MHAKFTASYKENTMARKRSPRQKEDPMHQLVQGILTLVLTALASWLAAKLTDLILRPAEKPEAKAAE
jgi:hypothetical protein